MLLGASEVAPAQRRPPGVEPPLDLLLKHQLSIQIRNPGFVVGTPRMVRRELYQGLECERGQRFLALLDVAHQHLFGRVEIALPLLGAGGGVEPAAEGIEPRQVAGVRFQLLEDSPRLIQEAVLERLLATLEDALGRHRAARLALEPRQEILALLFGQPNAATAFEASVRRHGISSTWTCQRHLTSFPLC